MDGGPEGFKEGETYSNLALCLPVGFGIKKAFNNFSGIKIEAGFRFTNTDYLDDVSTRYYDRDKLISKYGEIAGTMSGTETGHKYTYIGYAYDGIYPIGSTPEPTLGGTNPYSLPKKHTSAGFQRGNPFNDDSYMFLTFSVYKKLTNTPKTMRIANSNSKRRIKASF